MSPGLCSLAPALGSPGGLWSPGQGVAEHHFILVMKEDAPWLFGLCLIRIPPLPFLTHLSIFFIPPQ